MGGSCSKLQQNQVNTSKSEIQFVKTLHLRYNILRLLFPYKRLSFNEILEKLKKDKSNLSRNLSELKDLNFVDVTKEQKGKGAPSQIFSLSDDAREVLTLILKITNPQTKGKPMIPDEFHIKKHLAMLVNNQEDDIDFQTKVLLIDEIQILSDQFNIIADDELLYLFKKAMTNNELRDKLSILLMSIQNILKNNVDENTREEIEEILGEFILKLRSRSDISDRAKIIAEKINAELKNSIKSYNALKTRYLHFLRQPKISATQIGNIRKKIMNLHPRQSPEMRLELINIRSTITNNERARAQKKIIDLEITQFR